MAGQAGAVHWFDFLSFFFLSSFFFFFSFLSCVFALHGTVSFNILSVLLSPDLRELHTGTLPEAVLILRVSALCS